MKDLIRLDLLVAALCVALAGCVTVTDEPPERTPSEQAASHRNVGIDHVINGRTAFGIRELRLAAGIEPTDALTQLWLGQAFRMKGRFEEALQHTQRALDLDPGHHEARLNLSVMLVHFERFPEAIAHSDVLIEDPTFSTPWRALNNRGWAQLKLGMLSDARASFVDALDYNPQYWPAVLNLGILAQAEGDYLGSLHHFQDVLKRKPGDFAEAEVNYRMAEAYVSLGHRDRALHHLGVAIEQTPNGRWGRQSREYLQRLQ